MQEQNANSAPQPGQPATPSVVYRIPAMEQANVQKDLIYKTVDRFDFKLDVYSPATMQNGARLPAVLFIHGDGTPEQLKDIKDSGQYVGWGQLVAASGLIAVTFNHRSSMTLLDIHGITSDIADLITYVRLNSEALHIDADRLAIWVCSAGTPYALKVVLDEAPAYIRCSACYYGVTDLRVFYENQARPPSERDSEPTLPLLSDEKFAEFSASAHLRKKAGSITPLLIARAGLDQRDLNRYLDRFVLEAITQNAPLTLLNHPTGHHGFDILDNDERSHAIIRATLEFFQANLA
ncbi:MAG: prolyl oligopeptidase family serine peptidase [Chloroflexota bacterium]|nr:prolyl oligopeptidase family serine peptidase [Chloroflexota bacterium]